MAERSKQHTINYSKGICNIAPDIICDDNELQDCTNLTFNDGAIRPIQRNAIFHSGADAQLLKVHNTPTQDNYIFYGLSSIPPGPDTDEVEEEIINPSAKKYITIYIWKDDENVLHGKLSEDIRSTIKVDIKIFYNAVETDDFKGEDKVGITSVSFGSGKLEYEQKIVRPFVILSAETNGTYIGNDVLDFTVMVGMQPPTNSKPIGPSLPDDENTYYEAVFFWTKNGDSNNLVHIGSFDANVVGVEIIGNILIVNTDQSLEYFIWDGDRYKDLGSRIPDFQIEFSLDDNPRVQWAGNMLLNAYSHISVQGNIESNGAGGYKVANGQEGAAKDAFIGLYSKNKNDIRKKKAFCLPFFVLAAVELYDDSYILSSGPVLLFPTINNNSHHRFHDSEDGLELYLYTFYSRLRFELKADYSQWRDLVRGISVFVSNGIEIYDTESISLNSSNKPVNNISPFIRFYEAYSSPPFAILSDKSIIDKIEATRTFYKIADIGSVSSSGYIDDYIKDGVLETLVNQPTLGMDYFSHCSISADYMASYNRRLNITGVKRGFFEGFKQHTSIQSDNKSLFDHNISVEIKTPSGIVTVGTSFSSLDMTYDHMWFYYPDPRARYATIDGMKVTLKEHPGLNGAYYMGKSLPSSDISPLMGGSPVESTKFMEPLNSYLLQSEVDNPWVFLSSGYVRVGKGTIIGMGALTTALSQDAYKIATTIAFTTQGIWALQANGEGQYASIPPPFSREVCNNPDSITMVDHGVFFTSEKGLMLILDNDVKCVSDQLRGKQAEGVPYDAFLKFIRTCECAYDYQAQLLLLINRYTNYGYHWAYNIRSDTFSRVVDNIKYLSIVSNYPDTLLQDKDYTIYSMLNKPNINDDPVSSYEGLLITRPLKLDGSLIQKTVEDIKHITTIPREKISTTIEVSNDCIVWHEIPSLRGAPYKFHRIKMQFKNLKATDTFCGTIVLTNSRHTNKLR